MTASTAPPMMSQVLTTRSSPSVRAGSRGPAAGRHDDDVGRQRRDVGGRRRRCRSRRSTPERAGTPAPSQSTIPMRSRAPRRRPRRQPDLPAGLATPPRAATTSCPRSAATRAASRPAGPAPTTTTRRRGPAERGVTLRDRLLAAGRRVVDAQRIEPEVEPVDAIRRPDARPDPVRLARLELAHDVRVGHVRPHHPDHVDQPLG